MKCIKCLKTVTIGVLSSLLVYSCAQKDPVSTSHDNLSSGSGTAVVQLPDLSSGGLGKVFLSSNSLTLYIVASDIDTIKYSWPLNVLRGQKVTINEIPAGYNRCFEGFLTNDTGIITHSGKIAVRIIAGQQVPVYLKLSKTGSADVCIDIEGYSSACSQNDTILVSSCISGYYDYESMSFTGKITMNCIGDQAMGYITTKDMNSYRTINYSITGSRVYDSSSMVIYDLHVYTKDSSAINRIQVILDPHYFLSFGYMYRDSTRIIAKFNRSNCDTTVTNPHDTTQVDTVIHHYDTTQVDTVIHHHDTTQVDTVYHHDTTQVDTVIHHHDTTQVDTVIHHYDTTQVDTIIHHYDTTKVDTTNYGANLHSNSATGFLAVNSQFGVNCFEKFEIQWQEKMRKEEMIFVNCNYSKLLS